MDSFSWNDQFVTGLPEVDQQHQQLVDIINRYGTSLSENEIVSDDVAAVCTDLFAYAEHHFEEEEALMSRVGLDDRHVYVHIEAHRTFLSEAASIYEGISPDNTEPARQLLHFLIHWLAYHILHVDMNMARQIMMIQSGSASDVAYAAGEKSVDSATEPLVGALSGMFRLVSARNAELDQANKSLEAKVAERTKALSKANLRLEEIAMTDSLTGLPNRRHAMCRLAELWEESSQAMTSLACIMIDADNFKEVNDTCGHDAGDIVLSELARTLQHCLRNDDIVCRLGGDEFLLICPDTDKDGGMHVAELIREAVSRLRVPTGEDFWLGSISVGVAFRTPDMDNFEALIKQADNGVYAAKRDGRNCVRTAS